MTQHNPKIRQTQKGTGFPNQNEQGLMKVALSFYFSWASSLSKDVSDYLLCIEYFAHTVVVKISIFTFPAQLSYQN